MKKIKAITLALGLMAFLAAAAGQTAPLDPYPSLEQFYQELKVLADNNPDLVRLERIGKSVEGRPLYLLRIGYSQTGQKPHALIAGGIHAEEFIGARLALESAKLLVEQSKTDPAMKDLLGKIEVDVIPLSNPDGYNRVYVNNGKGGQGGMRKNAHGVDLNRNFPVVPGAKSRHPLAGNRRPKSSYYMGTAELSEPETKAVADLVTNDHYFLVLNLHSVAGKFLYPYTHSKTLPPDRDLFLEIGKAFASAQKNHPYRVEQSYSWYPTLGDPDDYNYLKLGIPSFTVEVGTIGGNFSDRGLTSLKEFWFANPQKKYAYWIGNDAPAVIAALEKTYELTGGKPLELKSQWEKQ